MILFSYCLKASDSIFSSYYLFLISFNKLSFKVSSIRYNFDEPTFAFIYKCKVISLLNNTNWPIFCNGTSICYINGLYNFMSCLYVLS